MKRGAACLFRARGPLARPVPCHAHAVSASTTHLSKCPRAPDARQRVRGPRALVGGKERKREVASQRLGGMTVAIPLMTMSPSWLVQIVSSLTMFFSGRSSLTVQVAVTVSPKRTGLVNLSSCPR